MSACFLSAFLNRNVLDRESSFFPDKRHCLFDQFDAQPTGQTLARVPPAPQSFLIPDHADDQPHGFHSRGQINGMTDAPTFDEVRDGVEVSLFGDRNAVAQISHQCVRRPLRRFIKGLIQCGPS